MKILLKNLFIYICLLLPISSRADSCETNYTTQQDCAQNDYHNGVCIWNGSACTERCPTTTDGTCANYNGCYDRQNDFGGCAPCDPGTYNNTSGAPSCQSCSSFSYSNPGQTFDTTYANTYGLDTCPWVCKDGYFDDSGHTQCLSCPTSTNGFMTYPNGDAPTSDCMNTCGTEKYIIDTLSSAGSSTHRYYCGQCGLGSRVISGAVSTCICNNAPGVVQIYGGGPDRTTMRVECECTAGATWQDGACKCGLNTYLTQTDNGYICQSCPTHSTSAVGSTNVNDCQCDAGKYLSQGTNGVYSCLSCPSNGNCPEGSTWESATCATGYKKVPNTTNHTFTCESCSDSNATLYGNVCKCNAGYYGPQNDLNTECEQCPIGTTTTTIGATQRNECKMNHNTKFCYGSGDNKKCMNLIPAGTVISVSNNT